MMKNREMNNIQLNNVKQSNLTLRVSRRDSVVTKVGTANGFIFTFAFLITLIITLLLESITHIHKDVQMMNVYISNTMNSVDNSLKDMGRVSLICFSDNRTQDIIRNYGNRSYKEQLADNSYLSNLYTSLVSIRDDISGIYIMDEEHVIYSQDNMNPSHPRNTKDTVFLENIKEKEKLKGNISGCQLFLGQLPEYLYYLPMYKDNSYKNNCIYLVRPVRSFEPYEEIGHIALITPIEKIRSIATEYLDEQTNYLFVDRDGNIICGQNGNMVGEKLLENEPVLYEKLWINEDHNGTLTRFSMILEFGGQPCIVTAQTSEYSDITLISAKPLSSVVIELLPNVLIYVLCAFALGMMAVIISYSITRKRLSGLMTFSKDMSEFKKTNLSKRYEVHKKDEVGVLQTSFNVMMDYINELVISEYKDKMKIQESKLIEQNLSMLYLKSQINPHFLYNTLDMIRTHAALNGDQETADILMELVTFYRLSTRVDSPLVSLRTEIEMIDSYMNLMKFRYMSLNYERHVEKELAEIQIPNFILQPLVENSLLHGLRNRGYHGHIILTVKRASDHRDTIEIRIEDDGIGMEDVLLEDLNHVPETTKENDILEGSQKGHIGIRNVQYRLRIYYGQQGSVQFYNRNGNGLRVVIQLKDHVIDKHN